jgi:recombination protein RecA
MSTNDVVMELAKQCGGKTLDNSMNSDSKYVYPFNCGVIDVPYGGGIHSGKIYEIFGEESNGKTTVALEITKAFTSYYDSINDNNYVVLWIESESALDRGRALYMGCKLDKFVFEEAETVEEAKEYMISYLKRAGEKDIRLLIVWDTLASASTMNERDAALCFDDKKKYNAGMMEKPRLVSEMLRTLTNLLGKTNSTLILVNQVRMKPGQFASTLEPPGGKGVRFHASVRTFVKKVGEIVEVLPNKSKRMVAIDSELFHVKNKLTSPKQVSTVYINTERGINTLETTVRFLKGLENSPIQARGGGYSVFSMPEGLAKNEDGEIVVQGMVEMSFQRVQKLIPSIETYPHLYSWLDYNVYNHFANSTMLVKIMVMDKLWKYEEMFFGERRTILNEEEQDLYNKIKSGKTLKSKNDGGGAKTTNDDDDAKTTKTKQKKKSKSKK